LNNKLSRHAEFISASYFEILKQVQDDYCKNNRTKITIIFSFTTMFYS